MKVIMEINIRQFLTPILNWAIYRRHQITNGNDIRVNRFLTKGKTMLTAPGHSCNDGAGGNFWKVKFLITFTAI